MGTAVTICVAVALVCFVALAAMGWALVNARLKLAEAAAQSRMQDGLNLAREADLAAQREALRAEFAHLAADLLGAKQNALSKANEESVKSLFAGLKERIERYEREVAESARSNMKMETELKAHVDSLRKFANEARSFTAALVGGNKIQGDKGEEILAGILEHSGLQEGVHYDLQKGTRDEGRPDVCIYDVRNRHEIFVDAKMNIKDYICACNLPNDDAHKAERSRAIKAHVAGIKRQIDGLSARDYAKTVAPTREGYENLPLVAMFCPFNAVLEAALDEDPSLVQYAYERNIAIVTPLTLWGYLWLVSWGWKQQAVEERFAEIGKLGGEVLSALDSALDDFAALGGALGKAHEAYAALDRRLTEDKGKMSVRRIARKLMDCGADLPAKPKQLDRLGDLQ